MLEAWLLKIRRGVNEMKAIFVSFVVVMTTWSGAATASVNPEKPTSKVSVLGVVAPVKRSDFEEKIQSFFKEQLKNCAVCEVKNLTPYTEKGELDRAALAAAIEKAAGQVQILFISWNEVTTPENQGVLDALKKVGKDNVLIVGPAGEPAGEGPSHPLSRTWLGQVPDAVIIGELNDKESLARKSFYGPEMLTAVKPPKDGVDGVVTPSYFVARLTKQWNKKTEAEWVSHFRSRKSLSRRIWPGLDEFFGR